MGVASFCVAVAAAATLSVVLWALQGRAASDVMAYRLLGRAFTLPMNMSSCTLVGLAFILTGLGTVLGVVSMFQRRRRRGWAIAGVAINALLGIEVFQIWVRLLARELSR